ncbi:MAG: hypothetical protein VX610_11945 [SAR324 cluster bacterium]|nr:hypothetical protein [SAR324 cluster bacterium]
MNWQEIRTQYPHQWLLLEAVDAHTQANHRVVEQFSVINSYPDSHQAMESYAQFHHGNPEKELYVLHTDKEAVEILERQWLGN